MMRKRDEKGRFVKTRFLNSDIIMKGVVVNPDDPSLRFGHCLYKKHLNLIAVNKRKEIGLWIFCPICKIRWFYGLGISELPIVCWNANYESIKKYKDFTGKLIDLRKLKSRLEDANKY